MSEKSCPVCRATPRSERVSWHWICPSCNYEGSDLRLAINESSASKNINESSREEGLKDIRTGNFYRLIEAIQASGKGAGNLLDVGCAHGWFLEIAEKRGFNAIGIEPDQYIESRTRKKGLSVRQGFFPEALSSQEQFDVITFNDVFEHLGDVNTVLNACEQHLTTDGLLVLNLPSSSGIFYKTARLLSKFGFSSFFERLWQKDMPSPHLHYFNVENLSQLLQSAGFEIVRSGYLPTLSFRGLYTRITYDNRYPKVVSLLIYLGVALALPILSLMPKDIIYLIARKNKSCH